MRLLLPALFLAAACGLAACAGEPDPAADVALDGSPVEETPDDLDVTTDASADARTVYGVVTRTPELSTLAALVDAAGLRETLADADAALTLFAPSDAAFEALGADALGALRGNPEAARALLLDHALSTRMFAADVFDDMGIESLAGTELVLDASGEAVTVRDGTGVTATVVEADLDADNGVVHVVDAVLSGPNAP
jgi:uncharacterized surface protein with fasciclin (FAS1) repeats